MSIKIVDPNNEDNEIEVFTPDEVEAQKKAAIEEATKPLHEEKTKITGEYEKLQKIHAEQANNFKLLKNMTEEEKSQLTAKEIEQRKISEHALEENKTLKERLDAREKADADSKKESMIRRYAGEDKILREKFLSNWDVVNVEDVEQRAQAVAILSGISVTSPNPLTQPLGVGEAPRQREVNEKTEKDEFFKSEKGQFADKMINQFVPEENK